MLLRLRVQNFKRFSDADIELGRSVVFVGPNNSGKTSALQAIALWDLGLRQWNSKRAGKDSPKKRPGVTINRRDLVSIPVPIANLLWKDTHVRSVRKNGGATSTSNVRINVSVDGVTGDKAWSCGFEFDYSNEESFVCRPLRNPGYESALVEKAEYSEIPGEAILTKVAYLPPMSGLADREFIKQQGEIGFLIGQGQTAQILRNLCFQIYNSNQPTWSRIKGHIHDLFGINLHDPDYIPERSEILMGYEERGTELDLSSSGRGFQQTLLLLTFLYSNPNTALLMDEPDAHLEVLRQRQIYRLITRVAEEQRSQIIAASHSEIVLDEAGETGTVVAFIGKPHLINRQNSQAIKALNTIGWHDYYSAETRGWVLYLEGPTDLAILQKFAEKLGQEKAISHLARPFVHYVATDLPQKARAHFRGLLEAKKDLLGIAIFDQISRPLNDTAHFRELMWSKREMENYLCMPSVLLQWARNSHDLVPGLGSGDQIVPDHDMFAQAESERRERVMKEVMEDVTRVLAIDEKDPWSPDVKASDETLDRVFRLFFKRLELPLLFRKSDYHMLAEYVPLEAIDPEIGLKLDAIVAVAELALVRNQAAS